MKLFHCGKFILVTDIIKKVAKNKILTIMFFKKICGITTLEISCTILRLRKYCRAGKVQERAIRIIKRLEVT